MRYIRDRKIVSPFCSECGCRLNKSDDTYSHFKDGNKDMRGHECENLNKEWAVTDKVGGYSWEVESLMLSDTRLNR